MYTGGNLFRISWKREPDHESRPGSRDEPESSHGPGPDLTPVESAQAEQPH